jgi:hypothetical protein
MLERQVANIIQEIFFFVSTLQRKQLPFRPDPLISVALLIVRTRPRFPSLRPIPQSVSGSGTGPHGQGIIGCRSVAGVIAQARSRFHYYREEYGYSFCCSDSTSVPDMRRFLRRATAKHFAFSSDAARGLSGLGRDRMSTGVSATACDGSSRYSSRTGLEGARSPR